jgi:PAS domain S-box-containing protein
MMQSDQYNQMLRQFYGTSQYKPLLSWDVYTSALLECRQSAQDLPELLSLARQGDWQLEWDFREELIRKQQVVVVTNLSFEFVWVSHQFRNMTGYAPEEVLGNTPRMLQGPGTDADTLDYIRRQVEQTAAFSALVINYRKDQTPYQCYIRSFPVFNTRRELVNFIAFEKAVGAGSGEQGVGIRE